MWVVFLWLTFQDVPRPTLVHVPDLEACKIVRDELRLDPGLTTYRDSWPMCFRLDTVGWHTTPYRFDVEPVRMWIWFSPAFGP